MKTAAECGKCGKTVSVAEAGGRVAAALNQIFSLCGRKDCCAVEYGTAQSGPAAKTVLLLCRDEKKVNPGEWSVCVAERELSGRAEGAKKLITYSMGRNDADFTARNIRKTPSGQTAFEIVGFGVIGRVRLGGENRAGVEETLAAACAAVESGIPFADVLKALNSPDFHAGGLRAGCCINHEDSLQNKGE